MISEAEAYEKALNLYPELESWKPADFDRAERTEGINWSLHLQIDAVVFRRISDPSLPDARVVSELERKGKAAKETIHEIARIVAEDLWERLHPAGKYHREKRQEPTDPAVMERMNDEVNQRIESLAKS